MAVSAEFRDHILDLLVLFGPVTARAMFGEAGLYLDGTMFALITRDDVLYFRTDDGNRGDYEAAGMEPFVPFADKPMVMPYHRVPPEVLEDGDALCASARAAWNAAQRSAQKKGKRRK